MKVIFLDIDGVLNPTHYMNALYKMWKSSNGQIKSHDEYGQLFFYQNVQALEKIVNETKADIVLSSTWRMEGFEKMQNMWVDRSLPRWLDGLTPIAKTHGFENLINRGDEIQWYIDQYKIENYVIIDDDDDMLPTQLNNFVQTNSYYGLTMADAEKAIQILNSK